MHNLRNSINESKSHLMLEALLDLYSHPVWITSSNGQLLLNSQAREIQDKGCKFDELTKLTPSSSITIQGKKFRLGKWEMNHGTDCCLHELKNDDDDIAAMRDGVNLLSAYLHKTN